VRKVIYAVTEVKTITSPLAVTLSTEGIYKTTRYLQKVSLCPQRGRGGFRGRGPPAICSIILRLPNLRTRLQQSGVAEQHDLVWSGRSA